jgi:hypothetical protein
MYKSIAILRMLRFTWKVREHGSKNVASKQSFWQLHNWAKAPLGHRTYTNNFRHTSFMLVGVAVVVLFYMLPLDVCAAGRSAVASSTSHLAQIFLSIWLRDLWPLFYTNRTRATCLILYPLLQLPDGPIFHR